MTWTQLKELLDKKIAEAKADPSKVVIEYIDISYPANDDDLHVVIDSIGHCMHVAN